MIKYCELLYSSRYVCTPTLSDEASPDARTTATCLAKSEAFSDVRTRANELAKSEGVRELSPGACRILESVSL
jgi:hypothetical protein